MSFPVVGGGGPLVILLGSPSMPSKSPRKQSKKPKISAVEKENSFRGSGGKDPEQCSMLVKSPSQ